jgi:hypothetical protein
MKSSKTLLITLISEIFPVIAALMVIGLGGCENTINLIEEQLQDDTEETSGDPPIVPVVPNQSNIVAEVLSIETGEFPQTQLTLQILESKEVGGFRSLLNPGETIKTRPQYIYEFTSGTQQLLFSHPKNLQNFLAYFLSPKDRIRATAKATGGNGNIFWFITDIERIAEPEPEFVPELSPIPIAVRPNQSDIIAEVLKVERKGFPEVDITLKIVESMDVGNFSNFLEPEMLIIASPHYIYQESNFTFSEPQNVENLTAYYLLHGDAIKATVTLKAGEDDTIWTISSLERSE